MTENVEVLVPVEIRLEFEFNGEKTTAAASLWPMNLEAAYSARIQIFDEMVSRMRRYLNE